MHKHFRERYKHHVKNLSLWEKFKLALEKKGYKNVPTPSSAICMEKDGELYKVFIGPSGSLRMGRNKTDSTPCSDAYKKTLLASLLEREVNLDA